MEAKRSFDIMGVEEWRDCRDIPALAMLVNGFKVR
jgi:hypothetical protein